MLDKNVDTVIIGKNYMSLLLALEQINENKKVLLIDDPKISPGQLYDYGIGPMAYHFLQAWGEASKIEALIRLNQYVHTLPLNIIFNNKWMRLSDNPSNNLKELLRCAWPLFGDQAPLLLKYITPVHNKFNEEVNAMNKTLGHMAFNECVESTFDISLCDKNMSPKITAIYNTLLQNLDNKQRAKDDYLLTFLIKIFFDKTLTSTISPLTIFNIVDNILGPNYFVDEEALVRDLAASFIAKGGQIKRTEIQKWQFTGNKLWRIQLASFEGIINLRNAVFVGNNNGMLSSRMDTKLPPFVSINLQNEVLNNEISYLPKGNVLFGKTYNLGTSMPMWWLESSRPSTKSKILRLHSLFEMRPGTKIDFIKDKVINHIESDIYTTFPSLKNNLGKWDIQIGHEVYANGQSLSQKQNYKIPFYDHSWPNKGKNLQNIYYIGPYRPTTCGVLSKLMQLRDSKHHIL